MSDVDPAASAAPRSPTAGLATRRPTAHVSGTIATPAMNAGSRNAHGWKGASDAVAFASSENKTWLLGNG